MTTAGADSKTAQATEKFLPFCLPDIGDEEIAEVADTLRSGWITTGPKTQRFESEFSDYVGGGVRALAVNSATAGLHLALEAIGVGPGDEVITTTYTFTATAEVIRYLGANPVFVDVRDDTLNLDPEAVEAAVTPRTKAIVPVHIAGLACDMEAILRIAARHGLRVIEDAAHALPATSGRRLIGSLESDATVFSFYATKALATGEGGMIVTKNPKLAARCAVMRLHGIDRDAFGRYTSNAPAWFYRVVAPGFKYNLTDIASAIGLHQLRKLDSFVRRRTDMARRYDEALSDLALRLPAHATEGNIHAWHLYVVRLTREAPVSRDEFIQEMSDAGIGTSVHFIPLHLHPYWKDTYNLTPEMFPHATRAFAAAVTLPLYTRMTDEDQRRVIRSVRRILRAPQRRVEVSQAGAIVGIE
jgi:dTDP-4-amino-4,6-dideoxygalactose transaminase